VPYVGKKSSLSKGLESLKAGASFQSLSFSSFSELMQNQKKNEALLSYILYHISVNSESRR
jgi:hypothetical protein